MASKVFTIICDVGRGKPYALSLSRNSVRNDDGVEGKETVASHIACIPFSLRTEISVFEFRDNLICLRFIYSIALPAGSFEDAAL